MMKKENYEVPLKIVASSMGDYHYQKPVIITQAMLEQCGIMFVAGALFGAFITLLLTH